MKKIFFTWNGLGDNLVLIGAAYNYYLKYGERAVLGVPSVIYSDLFECADFVDWCNFNTMQPRSRNETISMCHKRGYKPIFLSAASYRWLQPGRKSNVTIWNNEHLMLRISERMGLSGNIRIEMPLKSKIVQDSNDFIEKIGLGHICIMTGGMQKYKAVSAEIMQGIVDHLKKDFKFVQIGSKNDESLFDVVDCRGSSLLNSIRLLKNSCFLIAATGGLVHLGAAAHCKTFVLQTTGEPLSLTYYPANRYVSAIDSCNICARNWRDPQHQPCFYEYKCINNLTIDRVLEVLMSEIPYLIKSDEYPVQELKAFPDAATGLEDYYDFEKTLKFNAIYGL